MSKPNLQVACDHLDLPSALRDMKEVGELVDIIEVGTILILQAGAEAIRCVRAIYPNKLVVADTKCADAGQVVAANCQKAGADMMTVICAATIPTMLAAAKEIRDIQIELYGDWTCQQAQEWRNAGISQVIYHQSRDGLVAGETWGAKDLQRVQQLIDLGFQVSVTGGLSLDTLKLFKGMPIYSFIIGRSITSAENASIAAQQFQAEIKRLWEEKK